MTEVQQKMVCNQCDAEEQSLIFTKNSYQLVKCASCGLAYIANPPDAAALAKIYSLDSNYHQDLLDPNSSAFAEMSGVAAQHMRHTAPWVSQGRLLDIGCSTGLFLDLARKKGFDVSGIEFSPDSAHFAREHFGLTVTGGDIRALDAASGLYDVVTMFDVIEHVPDPLSDMRAIYDRLKPGGLFVVSTPNIDGLFPRLSLPLAKMLDHWPHAEPPYHLYQFSVGSLSRMLAEAGFAVEAVNHDKMALSYSFGNLSTLMHSPKMLAYALLFAPLAQIGPALGQGDWIYMAARKR